MTKKQTNFRRFIDSYNTNDSFNLLSSVRAKYGVGALEDFLEECENFISQEKEKMIEEIKDFFTEQGIDTYCLPELLNRLQNK